MTGYKKIILVLTTVIVANWACKDKYNPNIEYPNTGYLVVEGFINSGQGATSIRLSRTVKVSDGNAIKYEDGALVRVEGEDNSAVVLAALGNGMYTINQLSLNGTRKYRLYIRTSNGKEYRSEFSSIIRTPNIDSVSWTREQSGAQIHINTHDPNNKTWYYTWSYEETWEYRSFYYPSLKYVNLPRIGLNVAYIYPNGSLDTTKFRCWTTHASTDILLGSSKKLSSDVIHLPLIQIEEGSIKFSFLYSVIVTQRGCSERGYDFLQRMKKNTEQVGSIFDAQPSELNSNIRNISDPNEIVIGFIDVADGWEKRIFISANDVRNWHYNVPCDPITIDNNPDSIAAHSDHDPIVPSEFTPSGSIKNFAAAYPVCIDCRLRGGKTVKPSFWPF